MNWKWVTPLIPLAGGAAIVLLTLWTPLGNPIFYLRADLFTLALLAGGLLSLGLIASLSLWEWLGRLRRQSIAEMQAQATDDRRRFLRRLDHELKNPLTAIRAGLANLAETPEKENWRQALASVEAQTLRLGRLTADLRKLTDLETRLIENSPVDLTELLHELLALAQEHPHAAGRRLSLIVPQAPWPLPTISGDRDLLFVMIYNLLDNALKFTQPGDTVEVRAVEDGPAVRLEVADTGAGIPEEELAHVWEELYRGQSARSVPGSGLGLSLARAIAERHQGQVSLRSRVGQGTVVTLQLPIN
jgi:two-component system OmpR family sensor kinase